MMVLIILLFIAIITLQIIEAVNRGDTKDSRFETKVTLMNILNNLEQ